MGSCAKSAGLPVLVKNSRYYWHKPTWEFSLPAGVTCPFAHGCRVIVGENGGKFLDDSTAFRCYAASAERFPAVRASRWGNYRAVLLGRLPDVAGLSHVRIHMSGDFFSQAYFDDWLSLCASNPQTVFWAFTKSLPFWVARIGDIPRNLSLTASFGGVFDGLIHEYGLKSAAVFPSLGEVPDGMPVDVDDYYAANGRQSFALLDNNACRTRDKSGGKTKRDAQIGNESAGSIVGYGSS